MVPLWLLLPLVCGLWLSSWISLLDATTGDLSQAWLLWAVTAAFSVLLAMRLVRPA